MAERRRRLDELLRASERQDGVAARARALSSARAWGLCACAPAGARAKWCDLGAALPLLVLGHAALAAFALCARSGARGVLA